MMLIGYGGACGGGRGWRLGYSLFFGRSFVGHQRGAEETLRAADEGIAALIEAKKLVGGAGEPDADGFADGPNRMVRDAKPKGTGSAEVEPVVVAVDLQGRGETTGATGEIEKASRLAMALHEFDAFQRFEGADEDRSRGSGRLADHVQHEMCTVVEEDVDVPRSEIHGANPRGGATEMMPGGISGWIGLSFNDASAEAASGKVMDDDFADEEARENDGVMRQLGSMQTSDREFLCWGSLTAAR